MLEFTKRELEFKLDEDIYRLKFPNVKQMAKFSKEHSEKDDKFEVIIDFLNDLGLKKEVSEEMEVEHLTTIIKALTEEKK